MGNLYSLWDLYQKKGLSRRDFIKGCTALIGILGLTPTMLPEIVSAAERKEIPVVIWLHGHECTGCDEAFLRSQTPLVSDLVLNAIALECDETLSAVAGEAFEAHLQDMTNKYAGKFILAVEGGVALGEEHGFCMVGGRPFVEVLKEVAGKSAMIIEYGSCAAYGGIQAAKPNPTNSTSVSDVIIGKPIIKVPGCPPIPEVMTGVIMHYVFFGEIPPLDGEGRPKQFYGNRIHDTCYRRPFFDAGMFAETFNDAGAKAGWCLYKLGCRGPETYNSCGNMRWWNGLSYPIQSGHGCIGCANNDFWDTGCFYDRLPKHSVGGFNIGDVDKIGAVAAGVAVVGVSAHAAVTAVQKQRRDMNKAEKEKEESDKQREGDD